jgi:hypothetical protein
MVCSCKLLLTAHKRPGLWARSRRSQMLEPLWQSSPSAFSLEVETTFWFNFRKARNSEKLGLYTKLKILVFWAICSFYDNIIEKLLLTSHDQNISSSFSEKLQKLQLKQIGPSIDVTNQIVCLIYRAIYMRTTKYKDIAWSCIILRLNNLRF